MSTTSTLTTEKRIEICGSCINKHHDHHFGVVCGLTRLIPDFDPSCPDYSHQDRAIHKTSENPSLELASHYQRLANYLLDTAFKWVFSVVFLFCVGVGIGIFFPEVIETMDEGSLVLNIVGGFITGMIYYAVLESLFGQSIGKLITGTKVVTVDGQKPEVNALIIRSLCRFVPFNALSFLGDQPIGWHDDWSGTRVVKRG